MSDETGNWYEANQRDLLARLNAVGEALKAHAARVSGRAEAYRDETAARAPVEEVVADSSGSPAPGGDEAESAPQASTALDHLCEVFSLSTFERDLLLMCAGVELDASFAELCASAHGAARRAYPTFGLGLAALLEAHWSALTSNAPLRRWRLIELEHGQDYLVNARLRIDERVLHYLAGVSHLDERLRGLVEPVAVPAELPDSHGELARRVAEFWANDRRDEASAVVFLAGADSAGKRAVAAAASAALGLGLHVLRAADVPQLVAEREALARLWEREAVLQGSALMLEQDEHENTHAVLSFIESVRGLLLVAGRDALRPRQRPAMRLDVRKPTSAEQRQLWQKVLGPLAQNLNGELELLTSHFDFGVETIRAASVQAREGFVREGGEEAAGGVLWDACRVQGRTRLDDLAQHIEPRAAWEDLVLPEHQLRGLREVAAHVRQRARVYEAWGFASKGARGLGISALFTGASGTGKTMAAEVLANELKLDLYRIDLSQVVSKYIGETEKNLRRVFDAAEESGAVLLFDEADALFGKRSEVKDSHDRYANIEVSYLLQRMEEYRGLAILTTNLKTALDKAFLRRLRFVIQFPFPDAGSRARIWERIFPPGTPTENLDVKKLARLSVAGGNIRNIALNAAFLAADENASVTMAHLLRAARGEYEKLEKPLTDAESGGWV
ncbi:MAG TPA: AAA family ATPase [Pyrinomonadaceae bacterium]|nr:AAA family ATPase [Pyrinomonadaceae bacterium]